MPRPVVLRRASTLLEMVVVLAIGFILLGLLLVAVQQVRTAAQRAECKNHLRQIGLALHNFHGSSGALPPGVSVRSDSGQYPYLSWLTRILPFMEREDLWNVAQEAYRQTPEFFRVPPHVGLSTIVPLYACPADETAGTTAQTPYGHRVAFTSYLGVEGLNQRTRDGVLYLDSRVQLTDITDGTSNTLLAGERPPGPDYRFGWWYAGVGQDLNGSCDMILGARETNQTGDGSTYAGCDPGPYQFEPSRMNDRCDVFHFWSLHPGGAHFLFADGSVRFLAYSANPIMPALASRTGGEVATVTD